MGLPYASRPNAKSAPATMSATKMILIGTGLIAVATGVVTVVVLWESLEQVSVSLLCKAHAIYGLAFESFRSPCLFRG